MRAVLPFFLFIFIHTAVSAKEVVRLSAGEWAPYVSGSLDNHGLLSQLTQEAFAKVGVEVQIGLFPWARATNLSTSGEWDGTIAFVRLEEREKVYLYSDRLYSSDYVFFHLKSYPFQWNDYPDLKKITIATTRGYGGMGDKFLSAEREGVIKVLRLNAENQSFNMLRSGRVQAVPSDIEVGYAYLHKLYGKDADKFTHNPRVILNSEYHLVISKKIKNGPRLIAKFNEGLRQLRKSGRYNEILKIWYNKPIYRAALPAAYLQKISPTP
ncbi:Bacterial extracellular solute-binding protein, family 3 [compost metagenome]